MSYPGGKHGSGVYQQIINRIPPHEIYIEPFLGGGAIMKLKRPATKSIGMDISLDVIKNFTQGTAPNLTLLQGDAIQWLSLQTFTADCFIYLDPPYLFSTRSTKAKIYPHEIFDDDHFELLKIIKRLPCMVMISGYPNAIYDELLMNWHRATFQTTNRGGGYVTEKLWMNYPPPYRLHDYRYLGADFRERERLKKKKNRWVKRLLSMPDPERYMLAAAIAEVDERGHHHQKERTAPADFFQKIYEEAPGTPAEKLCRLLHKLQEPTGDLNTVAENSGTSSPDPTIGAGDVGVFGFLLCPERRHGAAHGGQRAEVGGGIPPPKPPDPIGTDDGGRSPEPTIGDLRTGRARRLLRRPNPKPDRD